MSFDDTIQKLKSLKQIEPDENFVRSTRGMIFAEGRPSLEKRVGFNFVPKWGLALGVALVLIVATGSMMFSSDKPVASSLDSGDLQQELESLTIQLAEVDYTQKTNQAIASALNEISTSQASHLNRSVLEKEQSGVHKLQNSNDSENINQMLDKVIF